MRRRGIPLLPCLVLAFTPSVALGEWTAFLPTPFENGAFLEGYTSFERDKLHNGPASTRWTDTFFKETLTLYSVGYSYHPRFIQYRCSISGAVKQENYDNTALDSAGGWQYKTGLEYDLNLYALPEHPYNLQLFARQYEPLYKEQAATQHNLVETSRGTDFRYRSKPYFFHAGYVDDHVESAESDSDVQRAYVNGEYFKRFVNGNEVSFNAALIPSWFTGSQDLEGDTLQYSAGNYVSLQRARLTSTVSHDSFEQDSPSSGKVSSDQLSWYEFLTVYLPWRLRTDLTYRHQDAAATIEDPRGTQDDTRSDASDNIQLDVIHRLYESLDTTYTFMHDTYDSSGGDSTFVSNGITLNYNKVIPYGTLLAGTNAARGHTDSEGETDFVNEPFQSIFVPGSFVLGQQNIDPGSIVVFLRSPLPPFEAIRLEEDVDYLVTPVLNTFEIRVFNLPAEFVVPGTYNFFVSYSLRAGDFELRTDSYGGTVRFELFDRLVTPYFGYLALRSDVLSGTFPGEPLDSTTYTAGLLLQRGPWLARGEYQHVDWSIAPYQAWLAEVQYVTNINPTTSVYATASYLNKHYPHGTSQFQTQSLTEQTMSGSGSIQKQLFSRNLYLSGGGSYTRVQGLVDSNGYTLNSSLIWKIAKLDITLGVTAYASDSSGGGFTSTKRDHEFVYLKVRRRLF